MCSKFLGKTAVGVRFFIIDEHNIHRAVADVGDQVDTFQRGGKAGNGGISLRIDTHIVNIEVVVSLFVSELHLGIFPTA